MKRFFLVSGLVGLGLLSAACSDGNDEPAPFAEDDSLEARLATDLGAPFVVERTGAVAQVISPLGTTKVLAKDPAGARAAAETLFAKYATDFGVPAASLRFHVEPAKVDDSEDHTTTVHLAQILPGTDIEVWRRGAALSLTGDGTLMDAMAFLDDPTSAPRSAAKSPSDAKAAALALAGTLGADASDVRFVIEPKLYAVPTTTGALVLRYRTTVVVADHGFEAWFDANTLATVSFERATIGAVSSESVHAWSSAAYPTARLVPPGKDPHPTQRKITVQKETGADGSPMFTLLRPQQANGARVETLEQQSAGQERMPKTDPFRSADSSEYLGKNPLTVSRGTLTWGPGVAVDVHFNALKTDAVFSEVLQARALPRMVGVVHGNDGFRQSVPDGPWVFTADIGRYSPSYDPVADIVRFGDGGLEGTVFYLPTGIPLDLAAHEWGHALVTKTQEIGYMGEEGMVQEVLADALGMLVAMRVQGKAPTGFGEGGRLDRAYMRNFQRPSLSKEVVPGGSQANPKTEVRPSRSTSVDWDCAANRLDVDQGCVHYNSGPGNHAFYLMVHGGRAVAGTEFVQKMALGDAEKVWIRHLAGKKFLGDRAKSLYGLLGTFALSQANYARANLGRKAEASVACAWSGVGFMNAAQLRARGIDCADTEGSERATAPSDCGGKPDGYHCSPSSGFAAMLCRAGSIAGGSQCITGQRCVSEPNGMARLDANGTPVCEPESP